VIHLVAIARRAGIPLSIDAPEACDFDVLGPGPPLVEPAIH
jgi:hypothetical protein